MMFLGLFLGYIYENVIVFRDLLFNLNSVLKCVEGSL
jgi:hypothetical protein